MSLHLGAPARGQIDLGLFRSDDDGPDEVPSIMLSVTPGHAYPVPFALTADEARALAAQLVEYADQLDRKAWPEGGEPGV